MKRILLALTIVFPVFIHAQYNQEIGLLFGGSTYQGDIVPNNDRFSTGPVHQALGIFYRKSLNSNFGLKANLNYGTLSGDDANSQLESLRARNLNFRSRLFELGLNAEWSLWGDDSRWQPFVYAGVSTFYFKPETVYNGQIVSLQPLGTEGQGLEGRPNKYQLISFAIPVGAGVKFRVTEHINVGIDIGIRRTFTDYIDDVSTTYVNYQDLAAGNGELAADLSYRGDELPGIFDDPRIVQTGEKRGNDLATDYYWIGGLTVSYVIPSKVFKGSPKLRKDFGCPAGQ